LLVKQIPFDYDPFQTSAFVQAYLKQGLNKKYSVSGADLSVERLDKLYALVQKASKRSVNSVVWNMLIRAFGDAKRYNKMFDIYNDVSGSSRCERFLD
jgi:pentatricopeptide repeat protein